MTDIDELLGGAERVRTRKRGFAPWNPHGHSRDLLQQVQTILDEYREQLPITLRQIFYRLIGAHDYQKDRQAYERLSDLINRARRGRVIPMEAIRDGGGSRKDPPRWDDGEHFLSAVRSQAGRLQLDHSQGQPVRLFVMCEAGGMVEQLAHVANPFGVSVMSSGGFESVTEKHAFAEEAAEDDRPTEVLHIGDYDPSGAHMFLALMEDVQAFAEELGGEVTFTRLAVTPEQIEELALPTQPKKTTGRDLAFGSDWTCQAEAIAPDDLAEIVRGAIEERIDQKALKRVLAKEKRTRKELIEKLK